MVDITIRELQKDDLRNGFLTSLDSLRTASSMDEYTVEETFQKIDAKPDHIILVAETGKEIVGCITLLIEQKFIHDGGLAGHIEDVAVRRDWQGRNVGTRLVRYALSVARTHGCYKTVLNCTDDVKPFYEKMNFRHNGNEMRFEHR